MREVPLVSMIKDSKCVYHLKGKMKGCSFEHHVFSYFNCHLPQKMERICPVFSAPYGASVRLPVPLGPSRVLCSYMKSWTSNPHRQVGTPAACRPFPSMAWTRLSSEAAEHRSRTSLRPSQDQRFSPAGCLNHSPAS